MEKSKLLAPISDDPLAFGLLIAAIIVVAVAVILYFLVFRKKIKAKVQENKIEKESQQKTDSQAQDIVSNVFKEDTKDRSSIKAPTKEELEEKELVKAQAQNADVNATINARNFVTQPPTKKDTNIKKKKGGK